MRFQTSPLLKPFSSAFSGILVWMIGENISKSVRFKRISVYGAKAPYPPCYTFIPSLFHPGDNNLGPSKKIFYVPQGILCDH